MAKLNVARKVRASGTIIVKEGPGTVRALINKAKRRRQLFITLTEDNGQQIDLKYALINAVESTS